MKKIIFSCPRNETEKLRIAVWKWWAWVNWDYSFCSSISEIEWYFKPNNDANPTVWENWKIEMVLEHRVRVICEDEILEKIISIIKENHSYETPHIEIQDVILV